MNRPYEYFKLFHPYTSIAVTIVTMIISLPLTEAYTIDKFFLMGLAMICVQFAIGLSNDLFDQAYDAKAKPWKPLVTKNASDLYAKFIFGILLILSFIFIIGFSIIPILLLYFGFFLGFFYNLGIKRTFYSWIPYSLALPTVLAYSRLIHGDTDYILLFMFYPIGLIAGPALNIANQIPGALEAQNSGEKSLIYYLDIEKASLVSGFLLILTNTFLIIFYFSISKLSVLMGLNLLTTYLLLLIFIILGKFEKNRILWPFSLIIITNMALSYLFVMLST